MPDRESSTEIPRILPRGRHRLDKDVVAQSQRLRLIEAMTSAIAEKGYAAVSVADVIERSDVSRKTFYEQFANKDDCIIAAYDAGMEMLNDRLVSAITASTANGPDLIRAAVSEYLDALAESPDLAQLIAVEMLAGGPSMRARRDEGFERWVQFYRSIAELAASEGDQPAAELPTDEQIVASIGGVAELIRRTMSIDGPEALPKIKEQAIAITWRLLTDHRATPESSTK